MKVYQILLCLMLALLLVAPSFCAVSIPTVATAAPTPGTVSAGSGSSSGNSDDGPPSVAVTEAPAPTSTVGALYGTTAASKS